MTAYTPRGLAFVSINQAADALKKAAAAMIDGKDDTAADEIADAHRMAAVALHNLDPQHPRLVILPKPPVL